MIDVLPVYPPRASSAESSPFCAARPACSGFAIVPKPDFSPAACVPASAIACSVRSRSSPSSCAHAIAAPNVPSVPVAWKPSA